MMRNSSISKEIFTDRRRRLTSVAEAKQRLRKPPYGEAIKHLRNISSMISPTDKLRLISEVCSKVDENVLEFWKGVEVKTEKLQLCAD